MKAKQKCCNEECDRTREVCVSRNKPSPNPNYPCETWAKEMAKHEQR